MTRDVALNYKIWHKTAYFTEEVKPSKLLAQQNGYFIIICCFLSGENVTNVFLNDQFQECYHQVE